MIEADLEDEDSEEEDEGEDGDWHSFLIKEDSNSESDADVE